MSRLIDTTNWLVYGIFTAMARNYTLPWANSIDSQDLDMDYYGNHSGDKITSALVDKLLVDDELTNNNIDKLASIIYHKYNDNWVRAWYALSLEYNPIHNYDGDETVTTERTYENDNKNTLSNTKTHNLSVDNTGTIDVDDTLSHTGNDNTYTTNAYDKTGSDTISKQGSNNNTESGTITETNQVAGFNSTDYNDSDKKTTNFNNHKNATSIDETDRTVYDTEEYTETNTSLTKNTTDRDKSTTTNNLTESTTGTISDSGSNNNHENGYETTKVTSTKGGNLGVTTTQQMLISELDFRASYNFFNNLVYKNVDEVLTTKIY